MKAQPAPSAQDYSKAFYDMEDHVLRVAKLAKLASYLASLLQEETEKNPQGNFSVDAIMLDIAASAAEDAAKDLDAAFLAKFNELVDRENAAIGMGRIAGGAQ